MNGDGEFDPFTHALREDLPSAHDEARLRARLASAGILAGAGVVTPAATAAATGTTTAGVLAKIVALPLAVKVGGTLALAGVAVVPFVHARASSQRTPVEVPAHAAALLPRTAEAPRREQAAESAPAAPATSTAPTTAATSTTPATPAHAEAPSATEPELATRTQKHGGPELASARGALSAPARGALSAPASAPTSSAPAVAAFPAVPPAIQEDEGTLRAETAVMEHALAALKQGDLGTARRELALHAARFPNGHLAPERDRALARIREKEMTP